MASLVVISGYPSSGKSAAVRTLLAEARRHGSAAAHAVVADRPPTAPEASAPRTWTSDAMCPDHYLDEILPEVAVWGRAQAADWLLVETAGLCSRCSPFPERCVGVFVIDASAGLRVPGKVGPMLQTCDVCVYTRVDRVSQGERLMFTGALRAMNPDCAVLPLNGLTGEGGEDLWGRVAEAADRRFAADGAGPGDLRRPLPEFYCSFCLGRQRAGILQV
jgi:Ni2+-binding GTPase involved in maturation of urease and hydrogenase